MKSEAEHRPLGILTEEFGARSTVFVQRQLDALRSFEPFVGCWLRSNPDVFAYEPVHVMRTDRKLHRLAERVERWLPSRVRGADRLHVRSALRVLVERYRPRVFYIHFGWMAARVGAELQRLDIPYIVVLHGSDISLAASRPGHPYARRLARALRGAESVLCASELLRQKALSLGSRPEATETFYLGVPVRKELADPGHAGRVRIVANGRHVALKGHRFLLDAFSSLIGDGLDVELVLIGEGPLTRELEQQVEALGIEGRVRMIPHLANHEVYSQLERGHLFVHPSLRMPNGDEEGLGLAVQEAMAVGLPVVTTRTGGLPESVEDGKTGSVVPAEDAQSLYRAMRELVIDPAKRAEFGAAGRARVETLFNLERQNTLLSERLGAFVLE